MAALYVMVGIPGSGKTTAANKINGIVVSADQIRNEYFGSAEAQYTNIILQKYNIRADAPYEERKKAGDNFVYRVLNERIENLLSQGQDCIYDATNVTWKRRALIVQQFQNAANCLVCIFLADSLDINLCLKRNRKRSRFVPEEVIDNMYEKLEIPKLEEGFDEIIWVEDGIFSIDSIADGKKVLK